MKALFVDTGYWIALEASDDQNHARAAEHWRQMTPALPQLVTTTYVLDEAVTFFNSRERHAKAVELGNRLLNSRILELIHVDEPLLLKAWELFQRHSDKTYSLTDCVSFVVMHQRSLTDALTFDRHFEQAGFRRLP